MNCCSTSCPTTKPRELAETIRNSGAALVTILNDILDFSKIEAGRLEIAHESFEVAACLDQVTDLFGQSCVERGLDYALYVDPGVPEFVRGDAVRLRQVLVNLVGNAMKFTPAGAVTVEVTAAPPTPPTPNVQLRFVVRDSGIGIAPERRDRLFKSFSQVDSSTSRRFGGTGLGLAISHRLVKLMGGTIDVASEPGRGSEFTFTIAVSTEPTPAGSGAGASATRARGLVGSHFLLVQPDGTGRRLLQRQLTAWGALVTVVADVAEAVSRLGSAGFHAAAVLSRSTAPQTDGAQLLAAIGRITESHRPALVVLAPYGTPTSSLPPDAVARISSPWKLRELRDMMIRAIGRRGDTQPSAATPIFEAGFARTHPMRILVADDNIVNRKVVLCMLRRLGYEAESATNGVEVLETLNQSPIDLVLLDVQMPEMDGLEATRHLRVFTPHDRPPVIIALTANARQEDADACLAAGMHDFLSNPIRTDALVQALERAFGWLQNGLPAPRTGVEARAAARDPREPYRPSAVVNPGSPHAAWR